MASINNVSSSNYTSSLYNSANIISGLASGLDTESMIENLVKAYQTKITQLQQKSTKIEWKQDAYRSIISKMYGFSNNYTSYTSSTNLLSPSFFSSAKGFAAQGENAKKVSTTGTSSSEIVLNSIEQMATSARYAANGNFNAGDGKSIVASEAINLDGKTDVSALKGSLNLTYGTKTVSLYFSENDIIEPKDGETNAQALARVIEEKLKDEDIVVGNSTYSAADRIAVSVSDSGEISFSEKGNAGNNVYISSASDSLKSKLGLPDLSNAKDDKPASFTIPGANSQNASYFKGQVDNIETVSGKTFNINLDGTTKQVKGPLITKDENGDYLVGGKIDENGKRVDAISVKKDDAAGLNKAYVDELNKALEKDFGKKVQVENVAKENYDGNQTTLQLKFNVPEDSDILINTDAGDVLKIGKSASNYLSTGKTLGDLLGEDTLKNLTPSKDKDGNDIEGKYDFVLNGVTVGSYGKDTSLSTIMSDINSSEAGVKVAYSKTSREFVFTTKDTGSQAEINFGSGLAQTMFGGVKTASDKFVDNYGLDRLQDGESTEIEFEVEGLGGKFAFDVKNSDTMEDIAVKMNRSLSKAGLTASYSETAGKIIVTDSTGKSMNVKAHATEFDEDLEPVSSSSYTPGQDAKINVTVNGTNKTLTRASNKVEIDGLTINLKGTFNEGYADDMKDGKIDDKSKYGDSISFQEEINADEVVDAIKNMIAEYNVMVSEIRSAYATMPAQNSNGSLKTYEPLTDEDRAGMSESAIQAYEEKAKQGLLFADSNLSNLYQGLTQVFNRTGADTAMMQKMGIGISYDTNNAATITFDEKKFREALEDDFDGVVDIFTRTASSDGGTDGIMQGIKNQLDKYGSTTGAVKGILVQQAGTPLASLTLLDNGWQKEIDNLSDQITKWQDKLSDQVDRYTQQFARLETLINQMNQQSSQLAGLMGG